MQTSSLGIGHIQTPRIEHEDEDENDWFTAPMPMQKQMLCTGRWVS